MDVQTDRAMKLEALLNYLKRVEAMAKVGLSYSQEPYDLERYEELKVMTHTIMEEISRTSIKDLSIHFEALDSYPTPKVDVRGVVIKDEKVLLVQEKTDKNWAMPGGWCDVGLSPSENVIKEVREEAGLEVDATRLLSVWDKKRHGHPFDINCVYKLNFLCTRKSENLNPGHEVLDARYFSIEKLPPLSLMRNTEEQIIQLVQLARTSTPVEFD